MSLETGAWMREATQLHQSGRLAEASALYQRVLAVDPRHADALHLSGLVAYKQGRFDEAIALVRRALDLVPASAVFHGNLGNVLKDAGRRDEARASYERALALDPAHVPARNNLGVLLLEAGDHAAAADAFRAAIAQRPGHARAHANLGKALIALGDLDAAARSLRRAVELDPNFANALGDLGLLLQRQGRRDDAIRAFADRVALEPSSSVAHADLALALQQADALEAAAQAYATAAGLGTLSLEAASNRCALLQKTCDWDALAHEVPRVLDALARGVAGVSVGLTVSLPGVTPRMQRDAARNNAVAYAGRAPLVPRGAPRRGGRVRVGYLSADFRAHATASLISELIELHDRDRFEVVLVSYGPEDQSAERARLVAAADRFVDVAALADRAAAARIAAAGIDLLVDLNGATDNARMGIPAWRPAPVQVNWLGFPGTLGTGFHDYLIADRWVIPPGEEDAYDETVVRLPGCYQPNDRKRARPAQAPERAALGLPDDAVVLCSLNQAYKITPDVFAAWMRILAAVPAAVLWLYDDNAIATRRLAERARSAGVDPARLVFAPHLPQAAHLARYRAADLALDTFPCTSHTTASDALWMGCPLLTITGATFAARVATSLVTAAGLPELATTSLAAYEALAIGLAGDAGRRRALRRRAEEAATASALFDTPAFARHLEAAYARMAGQD